jgi:hypothetical protein
MLNGEVAVTVTREEHHQSVLARYPVGAGAQRHVAVELGWCTIASGKYRGQPAIEVRLDGRRVGELTHAMSQRYAPLLTQVVARGGRLGCAAVIHHDTKGLQVALRLPHHVPADVPGLAPTPAPAAVRPRRIFSSHRPAWIAAVIVAIAFFAALANNGDSPSPATTSATDRGSTTTARTIEAPPITTTTTQPTPTTTTPPVTTTTTTPTVAPAPKPVDPPPANPKTTTKRTATNPATPPPPAPTPPGPTPQCDPNYSGCVPIASDVDCAGGSGNGPAYVRGPIRVIGTDIYGLDADHDGIACE